MAIMNTTTTTPKPSSFEEEINFAASSDGKSSNCRGGYSDDTDYAKVPNAKVPIFPDFVDNFPDFHLFLCNFHVICIRP